MSSFLLLGAGTDASAGGPPVNNIVTNGTGAAGNASANTANLSAITTSLSNCIIMLGAEANGITVAPTVTDTASLTWHTVGTNVNGTNVISLYWALMPSAGSTTITIANASATYLEGWAQAFSGANTVTPMDASGAATSSTSTVSLTTSNAADALIVAVRAVSPTTAPTGFTKDASSTFGYIAHENVTATQSSVSITDPSGTANGMVAVGLKST